MAHEIDFEIIEMKLQIAQIELDPGESVVAEAKHDVLRQWNSA